LVALDSFSREDKLKTEDYEMLVIADKVVGSCSIPRVELKSR